MVLYYDGVKLTQSQMQIILDRLSLLSEFAETYKEIIQPLLDGLDELDRSYHKQQSFKEKWIDKMWNNPLFSLEEVMFYAKSLRDAKSGYKFLCDAYRQSPDEETRRLIGSLSIVKYHTLPK